MPVFIREGSKTKYAFNIGDYIQYIDGIYHIKRIIIFNKINDNVLLLNPDNMKVESSFDSMPKLNEFLNKQVILDYVPSQDIRIIAGNEK